MRRRLTAVFLSLWLASVNAGIYGEGALVQWVPYAGLKPPIAAVFGRNSFTALVAYDPRFVAAGDPIAVRFQLFRSDVVAFLTYDMLKSQSASNFLSPKLISRDGKSQTSIALQPIDESLVYDHELLEGAGAEGLDCIAVHSLSRSQSLPVPTLVMALESSRSRNPERRILNTAYLPGDRCAATYLRFSRWVKSISYE